MNTIGITGHKGFIGTNLIDFIQNKAKNTVKILKFDGDVRNSKQIEKFVSKCHLVVHLAGKNRAEDKEILETNIQGTLNVTNACYSHKKGIICVGTRYSKEDAYLVSKNVCESILTEYNKIGLQGLHIKLDKVIGPYARPLYNSFVTTLMYNIARDWNLTREWASMVKNENEMLELLDVEDVSKWIYSFSDAFLTNGAFYVKKFEFWDPIRISMKDLMNLLTGKVVENVSVEHSQKILKIFEWYKEQAKNEISKT